jgi:hypothetical protein
MFTTMPTKLRAEQHDADAVRDLLHGLKLKHLRVRRRAELVTIESGPTDWPVPHARLRREGVHIWRLEMANGEHWAPTFHRGQRDVMVRLLVDQYPWMVERVV